MCYYLLPHISKKLIPSDVELKLSEDYQNNISKTSFVYLSKLKKEIEKHMHKWDNYKKFTNTYEYIHTQVPGCKFSVSKYKPLSRSYFKLIEIINIFGLLDNIKYTKIQSFHLCEGPGGFIEAMVSMRNNPEDKYYGMSLINNDENTPGWKKSIKFLKNNKNVMIEYGKDNTGNILNKENFNYCVTKYGNSFHIITGDGGFDFSVNFNNQENICNKLILYQILYAIMLQKSKGSFILKIFDMFTKSTDDYIYLLSLFYNKVYIIKPQTSRLANSEKYIVCKEFKTFTKSNMNSYLQLFNKIIDESEYSDNNTFITSFFKQKIPYFYISKLEEISNVLCQFQLNIINNTIQLIKYNKTDSKEKIDEMVNNNISKCMQWCVKNSINYNKFTIK